MGYNSPLKSSLSRIHVKENSKRIWIFVHISMYVVLGVKHVYIRAYRFKRHVYHFSHVFRDGQGNIKGEKVVQGVQGVCSGTRERPYKCDSPGVVKSAITPTSQGMVYGHVCSSIVKTQGFSVNIERDIFS